METLVEKLRELIRAKDGCPKEVHWLGLGLQIWSLGIFLCTFSNGFFISRILLWGRFSGKVTYAYFPQFWYVIAGCTILPLAAHYLKRRSRTAWLLMVVLMASMTSMCIVFLVPELKDLARISYPTVIVHAVIGMNVMVVLFRNRANLFMNWEHTPDWALEEGTKESRKLVVVDFSNWRKELVDAGFLLLKFTVTGTALAASLFMLNDLTGDGMKSYGRFFSMSDAIQKKSLWRQKLILRSIPLLYLASPCGCRGDYLDSAIASGGIETTRVFDEAYAELFRYSDPTALDEVRVRGLTYGLFAQRDDVIHYYYQFNADRLTPDSSFRCLSAAVKSGSFKNVKYLLSRGHQLSVVGQWRQESLLEHTVYARRKSMARWLIAQGLNPDTRNKDGETPLFRAIASHKVEMADLFVEHGATPQIINADGDTLFHVFARSYWKDDDVAASKTLFWLRDHGVSPKTLNDNWNDAHDLVYDQYKENWVKLLEQKPPNKTTHSWFEELQTENSKQDSKTYYE